MLTTIILNVLKFLQLLKYILKSRQGRWKSICPIINTKLLLFLKEEFKLKFIFFLVKQEQIENDYSQHQRKLQKKSKINSLFYNERRYLLRNTFCFLHNNSFRLLATKSEWVLTLYTSHVAHNVSSKKLEIGKK